MNDREVFKHNLYNLMKLTKVRQIDVARGTGVSFQTVSAWITGRGYPRAEAMEKLCKYFGVKQSVLTEIKGEQNDEERILSDFRCLSPEGKEKFLERLSELTKLYPKRVKKDG